MFHSLTRRSFLATAGALTATTIARRLKGQTANQILWHDVQEWGVEGKGWKDTKQYFDRLPGRAEGKVRDAVWGLSRHSAGMSVRFATDSTEIWADYAVTSANLAMPHMPATGVSGLDLYAQTDDGHWQWISVVKPTQQSDQVNIISGLLPGKRNYMIYLPLYNGTASLKVGVAASRIFEPIEPRKSPPIVFYGTSITHGACASRPGMPHPSILGRRLDQPILNLGFSGNGKMEKEVGDFLCELNPAIYVIDCLPNMVESEVAERTVPLVQQLKAARPNVPIVLVEDRTYANTPFLPTRVDRHAGSRAALKAAYDSLVSAGTKKLYYIEGETLLGEDREDTTDGSHPSDLGFFRQANAFEPVLRKALQNT